MLTTAVLSCEIEERPEPLVPFTAMPSSAFSKTAPVQQIDPKDPEGFHQRCSGYSRRKGTRCSAMIKRQPHHASKSHPTFLPTCYSHKDQQIYAGRCQFIQKDGERCLRLFRWTPLRYELCTEHQAHPDTPCYFMALPLELRLEVFGYLLPRKPIGSSTSLLHVDEEEDSPGWFCLYTAAGSHESAARRGILRGSGRISPVERSTTKSAFPVPLIDILLVSKQFCAEIKNLLYSTVPFTIDVRKDGTFMCGRRLLEPRRADGTSHFDANEVDSMKSRFLKTFDFAAVKNYSVDVLVENWRNDVAHGLHPSHWDEEVEIYDIRDYVGVVVSGILAKANNLCKLQVRLGLSKFYWNEEQLLRNVKAIVGPFERLRNVRQPRLWGVYDSTPNTNFMISLPLPSQTPPGPVRLNSVPDSRPCTPLCSVPQLPAKAPFKMCSEVPFGKYRSSWEYWIASTSSTSLVSKPPIRAMFTEFKDFYTKLSLIIPEAVTRTGRLAFLHRARVAREHEDIETFRLLRNELIDSWYTHLEQQDRRREDISQRLSKMLEVDVYPSTPNETNKWISRKAFTPGPSTTASSAHSPLVLDMETMRKEGIPVQGNVKSSISDHDLRLARQTRVQHNTHQAAHSHHIMAIDQLSARPVRTMATTDLLVRSQTSRKDYPKNLTMQRCQQQQPRPSFPTSSIFQTRNLSMPVDPQTQRQEGAASWNDANVNAMQHFTPPTSSRSTSRCNHVTQYQGEERQKVNFDQPTQARPSSHLDGMVQEQQDSDVKSRALQSRVDSGLGVNDWMEVSRTEVNENGDGIMLVEEEDVFRAWREPGFESGKGKGKAVVKEEE